MAYELGSMEIAEEEEEEGAAADESVEEPAAAAAVELIGTPLLTTTAAVPAARASCPPFPGKISTLWIGVPTGMSDSGSALPGETGDPGPQETTSPGVRPAGARM